MLLFSVFFTLFRRSSCTGVAPLDWSHSQVVSCNLMMGQMKITSSWIPSYCWGPWNKPQIWMSWWGDCEALLAVASEASQVCWWLIVDILSSVKGSCRSQHKDTTLASWNFILKEDFINVVSQSNWENGLYYCFLSTKSYIVLSMQSVLYTTRFPYISMCHIWPKHCMNISNQSSMALSCHFLICPHKNLLTIY